MMGHSSDTYARDTTSYTLTVSGDPRFRETVHALTAKTAEQAGTVASEAGRLADAVRVLMDTVVRAVASPAAPDVMQVRFHVEPDALRVELTCEAPSGTRAGWSFERALAEAGWLEAFLELAPDAEFSVSGAHHRCRLACTQIERS